METIVRILLALAIGLSTADMIGPPQLRFKRAAGKLLIHSGQRVAQFIPY